MSETPQLTTLGHILQNVDDYFWEDILFLPDATPWAADTKCVVLEDELEYDPEDYDPDRDRPAFATQNGLTNELQMALVIEVLDSLEEQVGEATLDQMIEALNYFWKNDDFIGYEGDDEE